MESGENYRGKGEIREKKVKGTDIKKRESKVEVEKNTKRKGGKMQEGKGEVKKNILRNMN